MSGEADVRQRHPAVDLLRRYRSVFAAAWEARHELAGPKRLASEAAFLPAALEIQETPVHPAPRRAAWAIMALFTIVVVWSIVGQVDIVAVAHGRIVVSDGTKVVQPLEAGVIRAIHVRDGDKVTAGQVLIELDATSAAADRIGVDQQLGAARQDAARALALLQALRTGRMPPVEPEAQQQASAEWADISARLARLGAEAARREAEIATVREGVSKLQATLPLARQREADIQALSTQGFVAGHAGQDRTRERIEIERDLSAQQARLKEAEATLAESRQNKAAYLAETQRSLNDRLAKAGLDQSQLQQQGAKTAQREQLTKLKAPVAGTVQQLAVFSTGGVVTPAQTLLVIVPDGAEVTAEVVIENKDIGFVSPGQQAEVKVETFSFTRYGTLPATVSWVTQDAVNDEKRGAIFPATLRLERAVLDVNGKAVKLAPGMQVTAEVKTGRRRVIEYLLGPMQEALQGSAKER
ncbi:MAG: HlyD family type I secretion periplasmic adaptor subunit [Rubrivivax sp.]|nr:HlyD family type I secretion periplasmic adaptor subunit [Rubrivivax sp.]MDP3612601.1 HlyD family type I secretion periplasmic adaptor subunit [Rubrivivax sp.]